MGQFWENVNQGIPDFGVRKTLLAERVEGRRLFDVIYLISINISGCCSAMRKRDFAAP
jgi:hypothetical protein